MRLWLDTETFSETPIKFGTYRYQQDSELMIVTWAVDGGPVYTWDVTTGVPIPDDLALALMECDEIAAHNVLFDRGIINKHLPHLAPPLHKWRCTMVKAMSHSLPGSLDKLCDILQIPQDKAKHKAGKELVMLFCKPRPKTSKVRRATRETHPEQWQRFLAYAGADIDAMRAVDGKLPEWNYRGDELALWHLDQRINDRGFAVDLDLAEAAIRSVAIEQDRLKDVAHETTNGEVSSATKRDAMLEHILAEYNIALPDLQSSTLERRINDPDIPDGLKDLLRIRLQATTTSTTKYKALVNATTGGRLRGTLQFNGAGRTGRWAGRTFQPQNLSRVPKYIKKQWEFAVSAVKAGIVDLVYDNPMEVMGSLVRGCIVAPHGKKLVVADLSNIEGRVLAWLAGEKWKLQAFRDYDNGTGHDLYKLAYAKSFGIKPEDVDDGDQRQVGKVQELALGYEGGVGAFLTFAAAYGIDLEELATLAYDTIPGHILHEAGRFYDWTVEQKRSTFGLSRTAFIVCDSLKRMWREAHPMVAGLWKELETACIDAVQNPGTTYQCRKFKVRRDGAWLRVGLPSGRALCYPQPKVEDGKLSYMGVNQYTRQWSRIKTYGGKLVENATQAAARDVLTGAMPRIEAMGFEIVLSVHDELITEAPDEDHITPQYTVEELSAEMAMPPPWAEDMPLAAAGFETYRYKKD
jgi:DNA polymerase bacteriophage-type